MRKNVKNLKRKRTKSVLFILKELLKARIKFYLGQLKRTRKTLTISKDFTWTTKAKLQSLKSLDKSINLIETIQRVSVLHSKWRSLHKDCTPTTN